MRVTCTNELFSATRGPDLLYEDAHMPGFPPTLSKRVSTRPRAHMATQYETSGRTDPPGNDEVSDDEDFHVSLMSIQVPHFRLTNV
jgi:hypothetical protein